MSNDLIARIKLIKADTNSSSENEAATCQRIVLPILFALGWDIFNTLEVVPQYSIENKRLDYALRAQERNKVFLEIKKPSEDLEKHQEQLLNYAFREGVALAILTNGISWWFYLPLKEGNWEQRKFFTIDLIEQPVEDAADKFFSLLSKQNVVSDNAIRNAENIYKGKQKELAVKQHLPKVWQKIISEPDDSLVELINDTLEKVSGFRAEKNEIAEFILSNYSTNSTIQSTEKKGIKIVQAPQSLSFSALVKQKAKKVNLNNIGNLAFTKIIEGKFANESSTKWRSLLDIGLRLSANKGIDVAKLKQEIHVNIKLGSFDEYGYQPVDGTNFSVQGMDATHTAQSIVNLAKLLGCELFILFTWGEKSPNAGKSAYIEWRP